MWFENNLERMLSGNENILRISPKRVSSENILKFSQKKNTWMILITLKTLDDIPGPKKALERPLKLWSANLYASHVTAPNYWQYSTATAAAWLLELCHADRLSVKILSGAERTTMCSNVVALHQRRESGSTRALVVPTTVELHSSRLIGPANYPDVQKIRIIGFF